MRTLSRFLVLLLCLELIVSPIAPNLSFAIKNANAESCPTGFTFDTTLNRCLTKTETANVMNATMNCGNDKECYKQNAERAFMDNGTGPDLVEDKGLNGLVSTVANAAAVAGPVTIGVMALSDKKSVCLSTAHYAMIAGGLAVVIGDNLANMQHKSRLQKIQDEWGKVVNPEQANGDKDKERETSIEAQSQAFEMLAQAEDSLAKAAKMKKMLFMVATAAFGVSAAMSGMEILTENKLVASTVKSSATAVASCTAVATAAGAGAPSASIATYQGISTTSGKVGSSATASKPSETVVEAQAAATEATAASAASTAAMAALKAEAVAATAAAAVPGAGIALVARATALNNAAALSVKCEAAIKEQNAAAAALLANKQKDTCTEPAGGAVKIESKKESLYSYYSENHSLNIKAERQFKYNLKSSKDFISFFMNQKEMGGIVSDPLQEYNSMKTELKDVEFEDDGFFESFKKTSIAVLDRLNPIPTAIAIEQEQNTAVADDSGSGSGATGGGSGGGSTTTTPSTVNTNAAKDYKEVTAKGFNWVGLGAGVIAGVVAAKTKLGKMLIKPEGRLIYSGVMAGLTLTMAMHAGSQAKASEKRAELLRKMRDEFKTASGAVYACKSADRDDPGKPNCYCYTAENQRNPNRGSSQICQKMWGGVNTNTLSQLASSGGSKVCVNQNRQADATCSCRQSNTCMKVKLSGVGGLDMGSMSVLGNGLAPVNGVLGGTIDSAKLDPATLGSNIAKVNAINKALEKNPAIAKAKNSKAALELNKTLNSGASALGSGNFLGGGSSSGMPSNPGDAARMLEKELNKGVPAPIAFSSPDDYVAAPAPKEEALEFGLTAEQAAAQEGQLAEAMNKDLDYGNNDINQGSKANIFDVLSNRYQRSGMRRLFDEKGETKPEAAASTDITQ